MESNNYKLKSIADEIFENLNEKPILYSGLNKYSLLPDNDESMTICIENIIEELAILRDSFVSFQNKVDHLSLFTFFTPPIENFAIYASSIAKLFLDEINVDDYKDFDIETTNKLEYLEELRLAIISEVYSRDKK